MGLSPETPHWTRHFFYRSVRPRTTWKFRIGLVALIFLIGWLTRGWWSVAIAESLVCETSTAPSDAILVENFDPDYLLFERARNLRTSGVAARILVPVPLDGEGQPASVALGIANLMASVSRLGEMEIVPIREVEPISLNAARDIRDFMLSRRIRSVIAVSPLFRSRRSSLVYSAVLGAAGISVSCEPVGGNRSVETWTHTWHGMQDVLEQWIKLQYYKRYVLPFNQSPTLLNPIIHP